MTQRVLRTLASLSKLFQTTDANPTKLLESVAGKSEAMNDIVQNNSKNAAGFC